MPTTPQEKAAKWPWRIEKLPRSGTYFVMRREPVFARNGRVLFWQDCSGPSLSRRFPTLAAAIAAIAKTQE